MHKLQIKLGRVECSCNKWHYDYAGETLVIEIEAEHKKHVESITATQQRLDYLRGEIENEQISYSEIVELQSLAAYISEDDIVLREWAGIPE